MSKQSQIRTYFRKDSAVFRKTSEAFGGLSNMAPGYPIRINGVIYHTSEALYQACRFPHRPEVQEIIVGQHSPMTAKMKSKPFRKDSRPDWDHVRVKVMRWCLQVKLAQNWEKFSQLLLSTGDQPIVEDSRKDDYWGAKEKDDKTLAGMNVLGRLLMELREFIKQGKELRMVEPPNVSNFLLFDEPVATIDCRQDQHIQKNVETRPPLQPQMSNVMPLFDFIESPPPNYISPKKLATSVEKHALVSGLQPYEEYKESGQDWICKVPAHWDLKHGQAAFLSRKVSNKGMKENTVLSLSYGRIKIKPIEKQYGLVPASYETYQIVDKDNIIIRGTDLQNDKTSLRIGFARNRGIISSAYLCLEVREGVLPEFGYQILNTYDITKAIYRFGSGLRQNLDHGEIKRLPIFIPPLDEQAAIVLFLDHANRKIDRFIRVKRKMIALLNEQKQAIIHRAVTRGLNPDVRLKPSVVPWIGDIPEHWETPLIRQVFRENIRSHNNKPERQLSLSQRDGLIATDEMQERSLQTSSFDNWKVTVPGDLVLNRFKAHLGVFFASNLRGIVSFHYGVFAPLRPVNTKYYELLFHTAPYKTIFAGRSNGMTVGLQNLSNQNFYAVRAIVPPLQEQLDIVTYAETETATLNTAITRTEREIALIQEFRTRLTADVVTGKLDVREAAANLTELVESGEAEVDALDDVFLDETDVEDTDA